jgi:hypothetical protein
VNRVTVVTAPAGILRDTFKRYDEDCMPGTKKNVVLHDLKPTTAPSQAAESGWDPFEVWRTRVLQPRLAEARDDKAPASPAVVPLPRR